MSLIYLDSEKMKVYSCEHVAPFSVNYKLKKPLNLEKEENQTKLYNVLSGSAEILKDTYNVTASIPGYDNTTLNPTSITYDGSVTTYNFTASANGTLTLHVTDDGTILGEPIVGAKFVRTDSTGTYTYGSEITTDTQGNAVMENVPYAATGAPTIYFKQTASDESHTFDDSVQSTTLTEQTKTVEILNEGESSVELIVTDANYESLGLDGTLTLQ